MDRLIALDTRLVLWLDGHTTRAQLRGWSLLSVRVNLAMACAVAYAVYAVRYPGVVNTLVAALVLLFAASFVRWAWDKWDYQDDPQLTRKMNERVLDMRDNHAHVRLMWLGLCVVSTLAWLLSWDSNLYRSALMVATAVMPTVLYYLAACWFHTREPQGLKQGAS